MNFWIASNVLLWTSYCIQNPKLSDFGRIKNRNLQMYMLLFASLAYIANFIHVYMLRNSENSTSIIAAILLYYLLQTLFIPAVRSKNATFNVQLLLFLACIPIYFLVRLSATRNKKYEIILGTFVLAHVFINDFLLFGHLF